jgi:hypothetical protein
VTNSRRRMSDMRACSPALCQRRGPGCTVGSPPSRVSRSGRQVLGQHLNCSESRRERP